MNPKRTLPFVSNVRAHGTSTAAAEPECCPAGLAVRLDLHASGGRVFACREGVPMRRCIVIALAFALTADTVISAQEWPLWRSYAARFLDDQVRVIDRDAGDRTTSEGQAYAMFFSLVANDRSRFDRLLAWSERNLAGGDLGSRLPSWLWGRAPNGEWRVLDANSASDADLWMAYTLLEAGEAWAEPRYRQLGAALAGRIAEQEVAHIPN